MRIALITSMKFGLTQFIFRDVQALRARGNDVRLFALHREPGLYNPLPDWPLKGGSLPRALVAAFGDVVTRPRVTMRLTGHALRRRALRDLLLAFQFRRDVEGSDVIFAYFGDHKLFVGHYLHLMTGIPLSVTVRAYELYRNPNEELFREALGACSLVLTITEYNRRELSERFGVPTEKVAIVRQIVDLEVHRPRDVVTILIVGFFAEKKGHDVLLRAVAALDDDRVELWVVGDQTPTVLRTDVRGVAAELGLEGRIAFFGAQSGVALRALYREADIFCLPSKRDRLGDQEGFPNVIAEAMAFGKPVVSTRHAGIPEAVDDAHLVDENDVDGLARVLARLVASTGERAELGTANRERAEQMFSPANTDLLESFLRQVAHS